MLLGEAAKNIYYNIVGGLLTVPFAVLFGKLWRRWSNRKFKRIFGPGNKSFTLCYGSLIIHPEITSTLVPQNQRDKYALHPFAKPSFPNQAYSASHVGSGCELRGSAYLAAALGVNGAEAKVAADESVKERLDLDFISFGYANNLKTVDLASNESNRFAEFDYKQDGFVTKVSRRRLFQPLSGSDYGIILRVHPHQFPHRTWICCAGYGEWGTSGTAWFLGYKWRKVASRLKADEAFLAVIKVAQGQDESAELVGLFTAPQQMEEFIESSGSSGDPSAGEKF